MTGGRVGAAEQAARVNAAAEVAAAGAPAAEAARVLAGRYGVSVRQARRYLDAAAGGPVAVPPATAVFTVKLPVGLASRVRRHAAVSARPISAVVTQALEEFLARARRSGQGR
jgi:hypothetical protein